MGPPPISICKNAEQQRARCSKKNIQRVLTAPLSSCAWWLQFVLLFLVHLPFFTHIAHYVYDAYTHISLIVIAHWGIKRIQLALPLHRQVTNVIDLQCAQSNAYFYWFWHLFVQWDELLGTFQHMSVHTCHLVQFARTFVTLSRQGMHRQLSACVVLQLQWHLYLLAAHCNLF